MLRSLIAVLVATIVGLTVSKFIEGAGLALLAPPPEPGGETAGAPGGYGALLLAAWLVGAFTAALSALLIGRRWAPLGGLAAATVFLSAAIGLMSFPGGWILWPLSAIATAGGGYGAIRLLRATNKYPEKASSEKFFDS